MTTETNYHTMRSCKSISAQKLSIRLRIEFFEIIQLINFDKTCFVQDPSWKGRKNILATKQTHFEFNFLELNSTSYEVPLHFNL